MNFKNALFFTFTLLTAIAVQAGPICGDIQYPLKGNINWEQGSIEMWFRMDVDPNNHTIMGSSGRTVMSLFSAMPLGKDTKKENLAAVYTLVYHIWDSIIAGMAISFH